MITCHCHISLDICHLPYGGVDWNTFTINRSRYCKGVTSHTEVWIEISTLHWINRRICFCHLPYGGVDWNISVMLKVKVCLLSPPMRRCGLKFISLSIYSIHYKVTSHTEVWIEIVKVFSNSLSVASSPTIRRCGFKYSPSGVWEDEVGTSPPMRRCFFD